QKLTLSGLDPARFEKMIDDTKSVKLYTLKKESGREVCITVLQGFFAPGRGGGHRAAAGMAARLKKSRSSASAAPA
ncbi:MAG: hypothetical protein IJ992_04325, partial [Lentisphaeria bacterium]|nr:hypothetical protein [Lentisphaeria bacterium]